MPIILKPKDPGSGGTGGGSYDDTLLKQKIAAAENDIDTLEQVKADKEEVNQLKETKADKTEVNNLKNTKADKTELEPLALKSEIPSTSNFSTKTELSSVQQKIQEIEDTIESISAGMTFKGFVDTFASLPTENNNTGDMYIVRIDETKDGLETKYIYGLTHFIYAGTNELTNYNDTEIRNLITDLQTTKANYEDLTNYLTKEIADGSYASKVHTHPEYATKEDLENLSVEANIPLNLIKVFSSKSEFNLTKAGEYAFAKDDKTLYERTYNVGDEPPNEPYLPSLKENGYLGFTVEKIKDVYQRNETEAWKLFDGDINSRPLYSIDAGEEFKINFPSPKKFKELEFYLGATNRQIPKSYKVHGWINGEKVELINVVGKTGLVVGYNLVSSETVYENVEAISFEIIEMGGGSASMYLNDIRIKNFDIVPEYTKIATIGENGTIDLSDYVKKEELENVNVEIPNNLIYSFPTRADFNLTKKGQIAFDEETKTFWKRMYDSGQEPSTRTEFPTVFRSTDMIDNKAINPDGYEAWLERPDGSVQTNTMLYKLFDTGIDTGNYSNNNTSISQGHKLHLKFPEPLNKVDKATIYYVGGTGGRSAPKELDIYVVQNGVETLAYTQASEKGFECLFNDSYDNVSEVIFHFISSGNGSDSIKVSEIVVHGKEGVSEYTKIAEIGKNETNIQNETAKLDGLLRFTPAFMLGEGVLTFENGEYLEIIKNNGIFDETKKVVKVNKSGYYKIHSNIGLGQTAKIGDEFNLYLFSSLIHQFKVDIIHDDKYYSSQTSIEFLEEGKEYPFRLFYKTPEDKQYRSAYTNSFIYIEEI